MASAKPPGRLGDPQMSLGTDPRTHPQLLAVMKNVGLDQLSLPESAPTKDSPWEDVIKSVAASEAGVGAFYSMFDYNIPALATPVKTTRSEEFVTAPDGHKVKLIIYRPAESSAAPLPALVYLHGGGMVIGTTENNVHMHWIESLAGAGFVAIAVDFRNAYLEGKIYPFPTGLNDCAAGVQWVAAHKAQLGINKIVLQGESGGGNLTIATTLKAKKEGWLDAIDGACASIPYISGAYGMPTEWQLEHLPSLLECDGYFLSRPMMEVLVKVYDPSGENTRNPLAWPYWATEEDLKGLPPFLIYINELDPLRDEGSAFYRKLSAAGVRVAVRMVMGAPHGMDWLMRQAIPDQYLAYVADIKALADRV